MSSSTYWTMVECEVCVWCERIQGSSRRVDCIACGGYGVMEDGITYCAVCEGLGEVPQQFTECGCRAPQA